MIHFRVAALVALSVWLMGCCGGRKDSDRMQPELITPTFSAEEAIELATKYLREHHAIPRLYDIEERRIGREWVVTYWSLPHAPDAFVTVCVDDERNVSSYQIEAWRMLRSQSRPSGG